jgi:hypothetical protein
MALFPLSPHTAIEGLSRALDPDTPRSELVTLAANRDIEVRAAVASRVDAPMASLISLTHERDARVREALVVNPSSPLWVIQTLATDNRPKISDRALARLRVLDGVLRPVA